MTVSQMTPGELGLSEPRARVIGIRVSDAEYDMVHSLHLTCPIPDVPLSVFLRAVLLRAASDSSKTSAENKGTPKKSKGGK